MFWDKRVYNRAVAEFMQACRKDTLKPIQGGSAIVLFKQRVKFFSYFSGNKRANPILNTSAAFNAASAAEVKAVNGGSSTALSLNQVMAALITAKRSPSLMCHRLFKPGFYLCPVSGSVGF